MNPVNLKGNDFPELRKRAENKLKQKNRKMTKMDTPDLQHELDVRAVELEMQNEELHLIHSKLAKSLNEFTELFNFAPSGYFILDNNGIVVNVNQRGCSQLGYSKKQIVGKPFSVFLGSESFQDDFYRHRNLVVETEKLQKMDGTIKRKDGLEFPVLITSTVVKDENNNFKHFLSMVTDISDRKEHEHQIELALNKEKKLNELKSQFITIASHEFRTPLAAISLSVDILEQYNETQETEKRKKHFHKIKSSVKILKELLVDFLSIDEVEKGVIKNNPSTFNLVTLINELITEFKINNDAHTFVYKHKGKSEEVYLDKKLLTVCLTNLIGNAIKYSPNGGEIKIKSEQSASGTITISIQDEGVGIPEGDKSHMFEQFFRAKNVNAFQGTGLGLNITKKFVSLMEGDISFESKVNKGSTFFLMFNKK